MKRRLGLALGILVAAAGITGAYLYSQSGGSALRFRTAAVTRGNLVASVSATGSLNPVITVQVGSQVSGQVKELFVDFNSQVKRNQLIARIDPSTFEAKVSQARADVEAVEAGVLNQRAQVERARADVDNARAALASARAQTAKAEVTLLDGRRDLDRKRDLFKRELIARSELDTAQAVHDAAAAQLDSARAQEQALASAIRAAAAQLKVTEAQVKTAEATVRQKRAVLQQAQVDLEYTSIRSPVDGVVVARNVDVGQTVAASLSAPTLFNIAQDLTKMQVDTNVDEADIGRTQVGQRVTFTVDSFPTETFAGQVVQIRKAPRPIANVVTYNVVVAVDNPEQKLLPGMTANVRIVVDSRSGVVKVPNAALRFRPPGEEAPAPAQAPLGAPGSGPSAQGGGFPTIEQTRERLLRELKLNEEQQRRLEPILEESYAQFRALARVPQQQRRTAALRIREESRQKVRALLDPEQQTVYDQLPSGQPARAGGGERAGRVWVVGAEGKPRAVTLRLGISDGTATEVHGGELKEGQEVIVGAVTPGGVAPSAPRPVQSPGAAPRARL
ncbi:MAG: efflux RND transporter periplasmic adaptor subunit [Candidatus Rokubacteria bacterium]|nr:efflux RND transporter periplasmic adaptor subunit [Candidatus Rokubacteria bacterium]